MIVCEMKCTMCGRRFELELLDRDDPRESDVPGVPPRCPDCKSTMVDRIRKVRRFTRNVMPQR